MIQDILLYPDKRLETPCDPVEAFDTADLRQLVDDMFETMYFKGGVGLAAPQIGVLKQVLVIDRSAGKDPAQKIVLINPKITETEGIQNGAEGCLCFPGFMEQVTRAMAVTVEGRNVLGESVQLQGDGLLARAFQHEIDHLNGILFIRRMSALKRELIRHKIRKMLRSGDWGTA